MHFSFAVKTLDTRIQRALAALDTCQQLYQEESIAEPRLLQTFTQTRGTLESLAHSLRDILAANERMFDIVGFLTEALRMEHAMVARLQGHLLAIQDQELRDHLHELLVEEKKHEEALAGKIRSLGGEPEVTYEVAPPPKDISIVDLMKQYRCEVQRAHLHYEEGLSRFKEPEFQWILGQLSIQEQEHAVRLDKIIEKYSSADVLPPDLKNIKWVDPYMGPAGDRSWIE
jgi:rubrerythrin